MKLFLISAIILLLASCQRELDLQDCDDVLFLKDKYISNQPGVSGYFYTGTDTLFNQVVCGPALDSLLSIVPYDTINGSSMHHYRYEFRNHDH